MGAENEDSAMRDFFDGFDENGATAAELFDDVSVMDDFVMDVDRIAVSFEGEFDDIYRADNAGAKAAGADAQKDFTVGFSRHLLPKSVIYQSSIIPQGPGLPHGNSLFALKRVTMGASLNFAATSLPALPARREKSETCPLPSMRIAGAANE